MSESSLETAFREAYVRWEQGKLREAFGLFSTAARGGFKFAYNSLGYFYDHGYGIPKDKERALYWYRRGARAGDTCAFSNLGLSYKELGKTDLAIRWFRRAIAAGDGDAALELAKLQLSRAAPLNRVSQVAITKALHKALTSKSLTDAGREEAKRLLKRISSATKSRRAG